MTHFQPRLLIKNGTLIDDPVPNTLVVVEGNRIAMSAPPMAGSGRRAPWPPVERVAISDEDLVIAPLNIGGTAKCPN